MGSVAKCANVDCGAEFKLREGRLFQLRDSNGKGLQPVKHYWLCKGCSQTLRVEWRDGKAVVQETPLRAAC